jgi:hypothetical protein
MWNWEAENIATYLMFMVYGGPGWNDFIQESITNCFLNSDWMKPTSVEDIDFYREFIEEDISSIKYIEFDDDLQLEKITFFNIDILIIP